MIKSLVFICLSIIFITFYFIDVVQKFANKDTTIIQSKESILKNEMKTPFITFCMIPRAKRSILEKYNLSYSVLADPNPNEKGH